jgi:hypothetical protein
MRRFFIPMLAIVIAGLLPGALAAQDRLAGRWEGKVQALQGERDAAITFKRQGDGYTGTTTGMRGEEIALKNIKVDGNKITAIAEVESPQGSITINYAFELQGDALKGEGSVDFGGQAFTFTYNLKRAAEGAAAATPQAQQGQRQGQPARQRVEQPQQKQSLDYFAGQWTFKYVGRESALGPAPREGTATFTKRADGKSLDAQVAGKSETGHYRESAVITFDEATKQMTFAEKLGNGVQLQSKADWSSPISIRFIVEPVKIKGQTFQLRRTISVIAAHSFTVIEELSEDGGPFVRLGQAIFTKADLVDAKK